MTIIIDRESVKKYLERGDFKCLEYITKEGRVTDRQTITHVVAIFKRIAESEFKGQMYKDKDVLESALAYINIRDPLFQEIIMENYLTEGGHFRDYQTIQPACSKVRTLYGVPETICSSCVFWNSTDIVEAVIRAITDITLKPDQDRIVITLNSKRTGTTTFVSYKFSDIVNFKMMSTVTHDPSNKSWERVGRPVREVIKLYELAYGHLPMIPQIINADTLRLWDYILDNMEVEVENNVEVQQRIINSIEGAIPERLDEVLPTLHVVTPTFLKWYYETVKNEGRVLVSPIMVLKQIGSSLYLWIYSNALKSEIRAENANVTESTITSVITSMGGAPRKKLGVRVDVWRNLRGYEIPLARLPKPLADKLEKLYHDMEATYSVKLKTLRGGEKA